MFASFERFELQMTMAQAQSASHQGQLVAWCDDDVLLLSRVPAIRRQIAKLEPQAVRDELKEYGAWDETELSDHAQNLQRVVWLAAGDITDRKHRGMTKCQPNRLTQMLKKP